MLKYINLIQKEDSGIPKPLSLSTSVFTTLIIEMQNYNFVLFIIKNYCARISKAPLCVFQTKNLSVLNFLFLLDGRRKICVEHPVVIFTKFTALKTLLTT